MKNPEKNVGMIFECACGTRANLITDILLTDEEELLVIWVCDSCGRTSGALEKIMNILLQCPIKES